MLFTKFDVMFCDAVDTFGMVTIRSVQIQDFAKECPSFWNWIYASS